jgi:two-component system response regulator ResD
MEVLKPPIRAGNLLISEEYRNVQVENGPMLALTIREFELLLHFARNHNRPFSREQIIRQVWDYDFLGDVRVVDELVKRLRKKLLVLATGISIDTVWGYGYKATVEST